MKTGYFVITHDMDSVVVCFLEDKPESRKLFKDLNNCEGEEDILELWNDYNDDYPNMECWVDGKWPFNGYNIIEAFTVYQF